MPINLLSYSGKQLIIGFFVILLIIILLFLYFEISYRRKLKIFAEKNNLQYYDAQEHNEEVENLVSKTKLLSSLGYPAYQSVGSGNERVFIFKPHNQAPMKISRVYWTKTNRPAVIIKFRTVSDKEGIKIEGFERYYIEGANTKDAINSAKRTAGFLDEIAFHGIVEIADGNLFVQSGGSGYSIERYDDILNLGRDISRKLSFSD